jgi:Domain of unknown function (DUF1771)
MSQTFKQSQEAYARGDGALAKQLSMEGKEHQRKMESLNKEASDWIFLGAFQIQCILLFFFEKKSCFIPTLIKYP